MRRPLVAVVVFPGSNDDRDAAWALAAARRRARARLARRTRAASGRHRRRRSPRRLLVRGLPALRRDGEAGAGDGRRAAVRRPWRARARNLQRLPDPLRGQAAPGRAPPEQAARVRLPGRRRASRARRHDLHAPLRRSARSSSSPSSTARARGTPTRASSCGSARESRSCCAMCDGDAVNGSLGGVAGVLNESGNVMGLMPHPEHAVDPLLGSADGGLLLAALVDAAAEHAPRPPLIATLASRRRLRFPRVDAPRPAPSRRARTARPARCRAVRGASASLRTGARSSAARSRSTSRARIVTGPRRADPSVA